MTTNIDISKWEKFNKLQQFQIEVDSYVHILEYLLDKNIDVNHPHYQYYEQKYLEAFFNLFFIKNDLSTYIKNLDNNIVRWNVNFQDKTVEVKYE